MGAGGYSATAAGAALLPFPLVLAALSPAMGALAGRIGSLVVAAGFLLAMRIGAEARYWTQVLQAIAAIALGMAAAVSPLTTAEPSAVDAPHAGAASGLNSALARTGGLVRRRPGGGRGRGRSGGAVRAGVGGREGG